MTARKLAIVVAIACSILAGRRRQQQISSRSTRSRFKASWRRQPRSSCCRGPWDLRGTVHPA